MKFNKSIFSGLVLITHIGFTMLVPILLCSVIGHMIDERFGTNWFIILLVLGVMAGMRNVYHLTKSFITDEKRQKDEEE